jgi:hypothetical protein
MNRRTLLVGLFAAPAIIRTPGLLMAIRPGHSDIINFFGYAAEILWSDNHNRVTGIRPWRLAILESGPKIWDARIVNREQFT